MTDHRNDIVATADSADTAGTDDTGASRTGAAVALVNGEPYPVGAGTGVEDLEGLVAALVPRYVADGTPRGVAVALNDAVVPRGLWTTTTVAPGDRVEIVTAVQGG